MSPQTGNSDPVTDASLPATGRQLASHHSLLSFLAGIRRFAAVVDFGCAEASWLHAARRLGALEIRCYDFPDMPAEARGLSPREFFPADLTEEVGTGRKFDLAICAEVAARLPPASAAVLVRSLTQASDWVLFAAAMPHQGGTGHINENWMEYWATLFSDAGFLCYDILRRQFWHDARVAFHYRQNTCLYVRPGSHYALRARGYKPSAHPPSLVHPEMFLRVVGMAATPDGNLATEIKQYYQSAWRGAALLPGQRQK